MQDIMITATNDSTRWVIRAITEKGVEFAASNDPRLGDRVFVSVQAARDFRDNAQKANLNCVMQVMPDELARLTARLLRARVETDAAEDAISAYFAPLVEAAKVARNLPALRKLSEDCPSVWVRSFITDTFRQTEREIADLYPKGS